jgi:hypothetical protein
MPGAPADPPAAAGTQAAPGGWRRAAWGALIGTLWGALVAWLLTRRAGR